ncbi:MAG: hypothetical protein K5871_05310 [Lachnospiraceae bacterium]|nr:hypothetical protein [Lachnospiraceae bacterium]
MTGSEKKYHFIGAAEVIVALILALIFTLGRSVYKFCSLYALWAEPKESVAVFFFFFIPMLLVCAFLGLGIRKCGKNTHTYSKKTKVILAVTAGVLVMASCVLALLAYFPGILAYDSLTATLQACDVFPVSSGRSVIHTLLWNLFLAFEWMGLPHPVGLVLYVVLQILCVSALCGYVVLTELEEGCNIFFCILTMLYYALYPAFSVMSTEMTSEFLFSCVLILIFIRLSGAGKCEKDRPVLFGILYVLACLLNTDFLIAAVILFFILLINVKKEGFKKLVLASLSGLVISILVLCVIYPACGVKSRDEKDRLSVPVQQVASVYLVRYQELTIAEKFLIESYMQAGYYNPRHAEPVLNSFDNELYVSDRSAFWDLYLHLFNKYPEDFLNAFLTLNVQSWYPGADMTDPYSQAFYVDTMNDSCEYYPISRIPAVPGLTIIYEFIFGSIESYGPVKGMIFSLSIPFIALMLGIYIAVRTHRRGYAAAVIMALALWLTLLFGPLTAFVTLYPFFMLIPLFFMPVFATVPVITTAPDQDETDSSSETKSADDEDGKEKEDKEVKEGKEAREDKEVKPDPEEPECPDD